MDEEVNDCGNEKNSVGIIIPDNYVLTENFEGSHLNLIPIQVNEGLETPPSISDLGKQLLKASEAGHIDEIKLLMHRGAPFTADWLGTSPLHFAAQNNHLEVCRILLRAGISKDARTKVERTPLHLAVYYGHVDIVKCLLSNNADINCKDMLWMTPLHWAAQLGNAEIAQILVECGSEIDAVSRFDLTATDLALQVCRHDIVEIINTTAKVDTTSGEENEITAYVSLKNVEDEAMSPIPLETIIEVDDIDSENSIDPERLHITQEELVEQDYFSRPENVMEESNVDGEAVEGDKLSASIRFLQQHGITMLPPDDTNILSSILESGRSVTLTEVGKQVLNSTKPEIITNSKVVPKLKNIPVKSKKVVHILPQDYVRVLNENDIFKHFNGKIIKTTTKPITKRIVMRKNKTFPVTLNQSPNVVKVVAQENTGLSDVEILRRQLVESKRLVEDYKQKYLLKCAEAEKYKLLLLTQSKDGC